jgi:hypothetical protein
MGEIDTTMIRVQLTASDGTIHTETTQIHEHLSNIGPLVFI